MEVWLSRRVPLGAKVEVESTPKTVVLRWGQLFRYEKEVDGMSSLSRRVYSRFGRSAFDVVLDSVEKELLSKEFEEVALDILGYVWLEVKEIEVGLVVDLLSFRCWYF